MDAAVADEFGILSLAVSFTYTLDSGMPFNQITSFKLPNSFATTWETFVCSPCPISTPP